MRSVSAGWKLSAFTAVTIALAALAAAVGPALAEKVTEGWRGGFRSPVCVSVDTADRSAWVADTETDEVVHLATDATQIARIGGFKDPKSVSANSGDGSCWVADTGHNQVVHLSADGKQL